jgi:RNA polymerase sigma factor (sigma-70 family)
VKEKSDIELVTLARSGDKPAFGELVWRYQLLALSIAIKLVGNEDSARDLVQEALLQAWLLLDKLKSPGRFKNWLCGIVVNLGRSYIRDRKTNLLSWEALTGGQQFASCRYTEDISSPAESAEEHEFQNALLGAVKALPSGERAAILAFYYEQLSLQEIAAISGIPAGTLKVRLCRARKKLKARLLSQYSEILPYSQRRKMMVKVTIADVVKKEFKDEEGRSYTDYVVVLNEATGSRAVPVWIGPFEGQAIAMGLTGRQLPRPLTYNFFAALLSAVNAKVEQVRIEALKGDTFYAVVRVSCGKLIQEIDARPSDALALALRTASPIFMSEEVLQQAGIDTEKKVNSEPGCVKDIIKEIESLQSKSRAAGLKLSQAEVKKRNREIVQAVLGG